jgi:UDP:flavonoid glycosyltransferase YjiC (YdhE family)
MKFLLASWGSSGDLHPFLALAVALRQRGHDVTLAGNPWWRSQTEAAGIPFLTAGPEQTPAMLFEHPQILSPRFMGLESVRALMREGVAPALPAMYETLLKAAPQYDCLVAHHFTFGAAMAAEKTGVPWVTVTLAPGVLPSAYHLPAGAYCRAFGGPLGRTLNRFLWWFGRKVVSLAIDGGINRFRRAQGLPEVRDIMFRGVSPQLNLLLYSSHFAAPAPDYTPEKKIVGFCYWDPLDAWEPPKRLVEFLNAGSPPWLFTMGSAMVLAAQQFYDEAAVAMRGKPERAVLLAGPYAQQMLNLPPNVLAMDSAPYGWIMPRCAAVAHQCGIGTVSHVLRAGLPSVLCPVAFDQPNNAMRLWELGVGRYLPHRQRTAQNLYAAFREVISGPAAHAARELGQKLRAQDGPQLACEELERFVQRSAVPQNDALAKT